jgi:hypothetical protein
MLFWVSFPHILEILPVHYFLGVYRLWHVLIIPLDGRQWLALAGHRVPVVDVDQIVLAEDADEIIVKKLGQLAQVLKCFDRHDSRHKDTDACGFHTTPVILSKVWICNTKGGKRCL